MEVVVPSNFLSDCTNAIVNAYTILWLLLCVHESQYVKHAEEDYTDCNTMAYSRASWALKLGKKTVLHRRVSEVLPYKSLVLQNSL